MRYFACKWNIMKKYKKNSIKMYKHLVQQKLHNSYVAIMINRFVFTKLAEPFGSW